MKNALRCFVNQSQARSFHRIILSTANDYALQFTRQGTSDYVIKRGMPSLKAVTVCLWMKSSDNGTSGTPLSYAVSGSKHGNELLLFNYKKFHLAIGSSSRYDCLMISLVVVNKQAQYKTDYSLLWTFNVNFSKLQLFKFSAR